MNMNIIINHSLFITNIVIAILCTIFLLRFGKIGIIGWLTSQSLLANIFVLKQIELFSLNVTAADVFAISGMFAVILLQEIYDDKVAKQAIMVSLISLLFFSIIAQLHLAYIPSKDDFVQHSYIVLFGSNFRIIIASILSYYISQRLNVKFYRYLSNRFSKLSITIRSVFSIIASQFIDTILFSFSGLYGLINNLEQIILFSFLMKSISIILLSYVTILFRKYKFIIPSK